MDMTALTGGKPGGGSEDFAFVSHEVPTVSMFIAAGGPEQGCCYGQHHPRCGSTTASSTRVLQLLAGSHSAGCTTTPASRSDIIAVAFLMHKATSANCISQNMLF